MKPEYAAKVRRTSLRGQERDRVVTMPGLAEAMARQARACAQLGSPLYAAILIRVAEDIQAGGPCAEVLSGYEDSSLDDLIALRLLGGVHALVLAGRAPGLAAYYPSVGGRFDPEQPDACWPTFRATVAAQAAWIRDWLTRPPQTNEVGRANLLIAGLLRALSENPLPVRLLELGASAGLNLRADYFRYSGGAFTWGPVDSPVVLADAWAGEAPDWLVTAAAQHPTVTVVDRYGCDLTPIDPLSYAGSLALRAYIWPDQTARMARLQGALRIAARVPVRLLPVGAADFLARVDVEPGTLTVVWHSVMRQYVPEAQWRRVEAELDRLAAASTSDAGFAHICFEPDQAGQYQLALRLGSAPHQVLAQAPAHGLPAMECLSSACRD